MDKREQKLNMKILSIVLYAFLICGFGALGFIALNPSDSGTGATVSTTDTLEIFRQQFNLLDGYVRASTSTLGVIGTLSSSTGNLIVGSSSNWIALSVGANNTCLQASSTAQGGIAWVACAGVFSTSSAHLWAGAQIFNGGITFTTATGTSATSSLSIGSSTINDLRLGNITASRILQTSASRFVQAVSSLADWIAGTTNEIAVTDDGDGTVTLDINNKYASSSITLNIYDATTTAPYQYAKWRTNNDITITEISCDGGAAPSSTFTIYRATSTANNAVDSIIYSGLACSSTGVTTSTFTTSTVLRGQFIVASTTAITTSTSWSAINIFFRK